MKTVRTILVAIFLAQLMACGSSETHLAIPFDEDSPSPTSGHVSSDLHVFAESDDPLRVLPAGQVAIVDCPLYCRYGESAGRLLVHPEGWFSKPDRINFFNGKEYLQSPHDAMLRIYLQAAVGSWPDVLVVAHERSGFSHFESTESAVYRWTDGGFKTEGGYRDLDSLYYRHSEPWRDGLVLILFYREISGAIPHRKVTRRHQFVVVGGQAALPELPEEGFIVADFATLRSGDVFASAYSAVDTKKRCMTYHSQGRYNLEHCTLSPPQTSQGNDAGTYADDPPEQRAPILYRWVFGQTEHRVMQLPLLKSCPDGRYTIEEVNAIGDDELEVHGFVDQCAQGAELLDYFATWDGSTWTATAFLEEPTTPPAMQWKIENGKLLHYAGGKWVAVPLHPNPKSKRELIAETVWSPTGDYIMVVAGQSSRDHTWLLHNREVWEEPLSPCCSKKRTYRGPGVVGRDEVKQPGTNLYWLRCALGQIWNGTSCIGEKENRTLSNARQACPLRYRLPTRQEFMDLLGECNSDAHSGKIGYCNRCKESDNCSLMFPSDNEAYWSSTPYVDDDAWYVRFHNGIVHTNPVDSDFNVRCVRLGKEQ